MSSIKVSYRKIGQNFTINLMVYIVLALGRQNKSMDGSFNDTLDHVENSSFFPYAGPQCNGGGTLHRKNVYWKEGHRTYFDDWGNNWGWGHRSTTLKEQAETFQILNFP